MVLQTCWSHCKAPHTHLKAAWPCGYSSSLGILEFFYELLVQMGRNRLCSGSSFPPGVIFPSPSCSILIIPMLPKNYSLKILGFLGSQCCLGLQKYPYAGLQRKMNFQGHFQGEELRQESIFRSNLQCCSTNMLIKRIYLMKVSGI